MIRNQIKTKRIRINENNEFVIYRPDIRHIILSDKVKEIFGKEFVGNLELLNTALQISARRQPPKGMGVFGSAFSDVIRARLGQFTLMGRLFTASRRIYAKAAERVMSNALLNPQSLKELIEFKYEGYE